MAQCYAFLFTDQAERCFRYIIFVQKVNEVRLLVN